MDETNTPTPEFETSNPTIEPETPQQTPPNPKQPFPTKLVAIISAIGIIVAIILISIFPKITTEPSCNHQWSKATCTVPKTCQVCQTTEGTTTEHDFSMEVISPIYLCSEATTSSCAKYYYCCTLCSQKGSKTFEFGSPLKDSWGYNYYVDNKFFE